MALALILLALISYFYCEERAKKEAEQEILISPFSVIQVERTVGGETIIQELILPCGYRFSPNDKELLLDYLLNKILDNQLPANFIKEINLYEYDPDELPRNEFKHGKKKNEAFFFTQTEHKYTKGVLPRRTTKTGYWKASGGEVKIYRDDLIIGFKKILVFYSGKSGKGNKTDWVMHEYRVNPSLILDDNTKTMMERFAVCRIHQRKGIVSRDQLARNEILEETKETMLEETKET